MPKDEEVGCNDLALCTYIPLLKCVACSKPKPVVVPPPPRPAATPARASSSTDAKKKPERKVRRALHSSFLPLANMLLVQASNTMPTIRHNDAAGAANGRPKREIHPPAKDLPYFNEQVEQQAHAPAKRKSESAPSGSISLELIFSCWLCLNRGQEAYDKRQGPSRAKILPRSLEGAEQEVAPTFHATVLRSRR